MKVRTWIEGQIEVITQPLHDLIDRLDIFIDTKLEKALQRFGLGFIDSLEEEAIEYYKPLIDNALLNPAIPDHIKKLLRGLTRHTHPIQFIALLPIIAILAIPAVMAAFGGQIAQVTQAGMKWSRPTLFNPGEAISALWKGEINQAQYIENMSQLGYSDDKQDTLLAISRFIPQIGDLIRFTVRDVFNPDVVAKYGYDEGFDVISSQLKPHLDKIGVDLETLRLYWRSHWELPSVTMAYEMLHRGLITEDDIRILLRINDVSPTWIEPIVAASYSNYTRVDVRRMYIAGVLDESDVKRAYLDLGYNDDKAENMTAWTITESMSSERDLSKSEIINAYVAAVISDSETKTMLETLGYSEDETEIILSLADYKVENAISKREKRVLSTQYVNGRINALEFKGGLEGLKVNMRELELLTDEADARIKEKHKYPSKSDLDKWFKANVITKGEFRAEMSYIGYSEYHIDKYLEVL